MIATNLELIERIIEKTKVFGICWACTKRMACHDKLARELNGGDTVFVSDCIDFKEELFLNQYNWY